MTALLVLIEASTFLRVSSSIPVVEAGVTGVTGLTGLPDGQGFKGG